MYWYTSVTLKPQLQVIKGPIRFWNLGQIFWPTLILIPSIWLKVFRDLSCSNMLGVKNFNCVAALELKQKIVMCLLVTFVTVNSWRSGFLSSEPTWLVHSFCKLLFCNIFCRVEKLFGCSLRMSPSLVVNTCIISPLPGSNLIGVSCESLLSS